MIFIFEQELRNLCFDSRWYINRILDKFNLERVLEPHLSRKDNYCFKCLSFLPTSL